ncbi:ABC transporter permease [Alicyclobacillus sp. SO9]|uniref:ABC transporter permease n=1 Tax=Alicyclobacillus sp. SO9 TaxID=2665646 RepID=UPI0018E87C46|nr:ABC transporter permease [Alicyclobacillus sp. SO9]QQE80128.1 ABC transporter permease [Alicyclobacillus sp. SO9]
MRRTWFQILTPVLASIIAIVIGAIVVAAIGYNPLSVYGALLAGAFGGWYSIGNTLAGSIPLILAGLGVALAFKAGLFNIGADGQYWVGAMTAVWLGYHFNSLPGWLHLTVVLVGAMIAGGLWGGIIPGLTKAYVGAHEVITTMMMSYIGISLARYMIEDGPMRVKGYIPQSAKVDKSIWLTVLISHTQFTTGIFIALVAVIVTWILLYKSNVGFQLRTVGMNQRAAKYAGINVPLYTVLALGLSGVLAGLAGGVQMLASTDHRLVDSFSSGYGYTAIVVALLARNNPFGVIVAAIFFSALNYGGNNMQMVSGVPASLTDVLTGLIVFFVAAERLIPMIGTWYRKRRSGKHTLNVSEKG